MVFKSLWASIQGDPTFMRKVNGWFTIFWIAMIPVSAYFGLLASVTYVSALSLWALVSGHWSAWQAARVEVAQSADANVQDVVDMLKECPHCGKPLGGDDGTDPSTDSDRQPG